MIAHNYLPMTRYTIFLSLLLLVLSCAPKVATVVTEPVRIEVEPSTEPAPSVDDRVIEEVPISSPASDPQGRGSAATLSRFPSQRAAIIAPRCESGPGAPLWQAPGANPCGFSSSFEVTSDRLWGTHPGQRRKSLAEVSNNRQLQQVPITSSNISSQQHQSPPTIAGSAIAAEQ